jgi:hypothetical protein
MGHGRYGGSTQSRLLIPVFCSMVTINVKVLIINDPESLNNDAGVTSVAISPNGQFVAAGSLNTAVWIWDIATGVLVERLRGHKDSVYSVAFTPDGKGLVSGSLDKTLKFWDVSGLSASNAERKDGPGGGSIATGPGTPGQGAVVKRDGKTGSPCTMNFAGHKVRLTPLFSSLGQASWSDDYRIMSFPSPFRTTDNGSSQVPKTAESSSGILDRQRRSVYFRATKTRSFPLI